MVTTKKAKQGKGSLDVYVSGGVSYYDEHTYEFADTKTYFKTLDEAKANYLTARNMPVTPYHPNEAFSWINYSQQFLLLVLTEEQMLKPSTIIYEIL
jgi:hypothetical protein